MGKNYLITALAILAGYQIAFCQVTYNYTGAVQTYTVPCNVDSIRIKAMGRQWRRSRGRQPGC